MPQAVVPATEAMEDESALPPAAEHMEEAPPAAGTPEDTPGAAGSLGPLQPVAMQPAVVKSEPLEEVAMSKAEARATQQKMLVYLGRDIKKGDDQAVTAKKQWNDLLSTGSEQARLKFLKDFSVNSSQSGSKKWSWTSSTSREACQETLTLKSKTG
eukprot:5955299-Amphidinium_carterae.1